MKTGSTVVLIITDMIHEFNTFARFVKTMYHDSSLTGTKVYFLADARFSDKIASSTSSMPMPSTSRICSPK